MRNIISFGLIGLMSLSCKPQHAGSDLRDLNLREGKGKILNVFFRPYGNPAVTIPKVDGEASVSYGGKEKLEGVVLVRECPADAHLKYQEAGKTTMSQDGEFKTYDASICNVKTEEFAGFDELDVADWVRGVKTAYSLQDTDGEKLQVKKLTETIAALTTEIDKMKGDRDAKIAAYRQWREKEYTPLFDELKKVRDESLTAPLNKEAGAVKIDPFKQIQQTIDKMNQEVIPALEGKITATVDAITWKTGEKVKVEAQIAVLEAKIKLEEDKVSAVLETQKWVFDNDQVGMAEPASMLHEMALNGFRQAKAIGITVEEKKQFEDYTFEVASSAATFAEAAKACSAKGAGLPNHRELYFWWRMKNNSQPISGAWLTPTEQKFATRENIDGIDINYSFASDEGSGKSDVSSYSIQNLLNKFPVSEYAQSVGKIVIDSIREAKSFSAFYGGTASYKASALCVNRADGKNAAKILAEIYAPVDFAYCIYGGYADGSVQEAGWDGGVRSTNWINRWAVKVVRAVGKPSDIGKLWSASYKVFKKYEAYHTFKGEKWYALVNGVKYYSGNAYADEFRRETSNHQVALRDFKYQAPVCATVAAPQSVPSLN